MLRRSLTSLFVVATAACGTVPATSDAGPGSGSSNVDAAPTRRCDPQKPFATPTLLANVNTSNDETNFTTTRDELTGFVGAVVQPPSSSARLLVTQRASVDAAFAAPSGTLTAAINDATGFEYAPSSISDGLSLYFHRQNGNVIGAMVASRLDRLAAFGGEASVSVDGSGLAPALSPVISADGQTLYWTDYNDFKLRTAARAGTPSAFTGKKEASTMAVGTVALSADELTLYYANGNSDDVLVSTRASKAVAFGPGTPVTTVNSAQKEAPVHLSYDGCVLYLTSTRPGGVGGFDLWEAHRPQ